MTPTAAVPTVKLNDDHTIPVLGISVSELSPTDAEAVVGAALEAGYRLIDTTPSSGNEEAVGEAIAKSGIARDELYVITKLPTADQGFQSSQDACKASLAKLGLDYVDLYLVDSPNEEKGKYIDAWGGLLKSQAVGDTRSIGVSNFTPEHLSNIIDLSYVVPVVNQIELHPLNTQTELQREHAERSIVTMASSPLGADERLAHPTIASIAEAHGKSPAQVLARWNTQLGNVVLCNATDPAELSELLDIFGFKLTDAEIDAIGNLDNGTVD